MLLWSQVRRCEHLTSCLLGDLPLLGCEGFLEDRALVRPPRDCVEMAEAASSGWPRGVLLSPGSSLFLPVCGCQGTFQALGESAA